MPLWLLRMASLFPFNTLKFGNWRHVSAHQFSILIRVATLHKDTPRTVLEDKYVPWSTWKNITGDIFYTKTLFSIFFLCVWNSNVFFLAALIFFFFFFFFFFLPCLWHGVVPRPGIKPAWQQQQYQILNQLGHQGTPGHLNRNVTKQFSQTHLHSPFSLPLSDSGPLSEERTPQEFPL